MSHFKERNEKICLNCKAGLYGRYCHVCGQENREPKETVWGLITHFFSDITHFDGKFFSTTAYLVAKPGFLPKEYINGRRASYINPIRMYIFSSAIFFIIFFSVFNTHEMAFNGGVGSRVKDSVDIKLSYAKEQALKEADNKVDSIAIERAFSFTNMGSGSQPGPDSASVGKDKVIVKPKKKSNWNIKVGESPYKSKAEYDSLQKALPEAERDGWFTRRAAYRSIELSEKYKDDEGQFWRDLLDKFLHTFPYLLFVSLPLYALYLKLLYIRRKKFYYVDHGIFLIFLYIFTFLFLLVWYGINELQEKLDWGWMGLLQAAFFIYGIYYAYRAMYKFYGQGHLKTLLKFFILNLLAFVSIIILFGLFFTLTIFRV